VPSKAIEKLRVSFIEAYSWLLCNLISAWEAVIMSVTRPNYKPPIEKRGLKTITPEITELAKGELVTSAVLP